ncbi:MAG: hypothetical protein LQ350_000264 [Teloschistes chrysophthalmus]|nr:MAG: hypothetical protein LQ350_000264 [Niorma chrysophthalma]
MASTQRSDRSPASDETVGDHTSHENNARLQDGEQEKPSDDEEKGQKDGSPQPVGFFHNGLKKVRLEVFQLWARTTLILGVFVLVVLSLYWAVLFRVEDNTSSLTVFVVDFDGRVPPFTGGTPLVGPMITQTTEKMLSAPEPHLGYETVQPSMFDNDPLAVRQAVFDWKAYAAIIIMPNATAMLQQAVDQANTTYDPLGACQVIYVAARDQDSYNNYILPQINALETQITSKFGQMWTKMVMQNTSIPRENLQQVPQALSPAIGFSTFNLRPFRPAVITPAVTIGLIYLIILSFFSFSFYLPIHMKFLTPEGHPPMRFPSFIIWRWCATVAAYFFLSLSYSLISLAFQIPFNNHSAPTTEVANNPEPYGKGTFVVYWMINYVGMIALGLACENVAMVIGQPWTAMWLIFWVITNVSTSFYSLDLAPKWYYWGYAWPLHNIVEASRSTLFQLHSRIGLNFGVLFVWVFINTALFPVCCYTLRWKMQKEKQKSQ